LPGLGHQRPQAGHENGSRNLARAERGKMRSVHLAIHHAEALLFKETGKMCGGDLGGIGDAREHGLSVEHAANGQAVRPPTSFPASQVSTEWAIPSWKSCQ